LLQEKGGNFSISGLLGINYDAHVPEVVIVQQLIGMHYTEVIPTGIRG